MHACPRLTALLSRVQVGISLARMLTRKYRDSVSDIFILNANAVLRISLFVVCPFLEKKVVDKIHVEVPGSTTSGIGGGGGGAGGGGGGA